MGPNHSDRAPHSRATDPPRDAALARLLAAAGHAVPDDDARADRLARTIAAHARRATPVRAGWWDELSGWMRPALAASIAAAIVSGALLAFGSEVPLEAEAVALSGVQAPERAVVERLVSGSSTDETFTLLASAAGGSLWSVR